MKKITPIALGVILIATITGCRKDSTLIIQPQAVAVTNAVSFSNDMVPIFTKNCALSGCHADGGHTPHLSADKAFSSLMSKYIDTKTPDNSILYKRLTGKLSPAMPMGKASNPSNINSMVLAWIKQGAKNN